MDNSQFTIDNGQLGPFGLTPFDDAQGEQGKQLTMDNSQLTIRNGSNWLWIQKMEHGAWGIEHGAWSMEHGVLSIEHGVLSMEQGAWSMEY